MSEIIKGRCPHYRYKPMINKVTTCDGDVEFKTGYDHGVCLSCERVVPRILEM